MRSLLFVGLLASGLAQAQTNISGTFAGSFQGFDSYGTPTTRFVLALQCSLTCPTSAPVLSYRVSGLGSAKFVSAPSESVGTVGFSADLTSTGQSSVDTMSFPPGSAFVGTATSATCWCGNATGQGGYVTLDTNTVAIPPWISVPTGTSTKAGFDHSPTINAAARGSETVLVQVTGAGVDFMQTLTAADFVSGSSQARGVSLSYRPTQTGTVTITATLQPYGAVKSATYDVTPGNSGTGGGSSGSGGGAGGGGGDPAPDGGCSAVPALYPLSALAALWLRRRGAVTRNAKA